MRYLSSISFAIAACANCAAADPLPSLNLDPSQTTVSGVSSGGFMAVQLQVAFSQSIQGAGIVAGGPFNCADNSVWQALYVCMDPAFLGPDPDSSIKSIRDLASAEEIDGIEGVASDRIYMFHGTQDETVARSSMDALEATFLALDVSEVAINYVSSVEAGHGFVTENASVGCADTSPEYLVDCDFDQAGDILNWLYGELVPPVSPVSGNLLTFDQSVYLEGAAGMDEVAFVYVPSACRARETCGLHISLHGCNQGREAIGDDYVRLTGFNGWAETNNIVVLYPQATAVPSPWNSWFAGNPNGCWDWWGYSGADYLSRNAPQPSAIARMSAALGAPIAR
ncbi:extracellular catalytic domain type 2 short-chain-length polyhydroxyalkanoate depolymerase [Lutimaribacter saemankumensis]|nr:hypothetical protein [Lutimaribacter saemankumensis]